MSQIFNNEVRVEPGSGARIVTNVTPAPNLLSSGIVAVIGESVGGLTAADKTIYLSDNPAFFRNALQDGIGKKVVDYVFNPAPSAPGAQQVIFVRAQAATGATATITTGGATLTLTTKDKGAYLSTAPTYLQKKLLAGVVNSALNILYLYLNGVLVWTSPEVAKFEDLLTAIQANALASSLLTGAITGTAGVDLTGAEDVSSVTFTGGTSPAMTGTDIDNALALLSNLEFSFLVIASETEANYLKGLSFVVNSATYPAIVVAGGALAETVAQVLTRSLNLNSDQAILCTPGIVMPKDDGTGNETLSSLYLAAKVAGVLAGSSPEVPATWKALQVLGFEKEYTKTEREQLIKGGVCVGKQISGIGYAINKCVNTLQNNGSMIYKKTDGTATSPEVSIIRIFQQLKKELIVNSAPLFIGGNIATVTSEDIINFTKAYLQTRCSTNTQSNLIMNFSAVTAVLLDDAWWVTFNFVANGPINFVFFTGVALKP
jgi:DNA-binding NarL/FixJ family response regulator